ncbi:MAG: exopolysaccharide biosynthesis polyprenyl glycosylphosphotransferase [Candidatus Omnitrophica bacterium]|nr:exopolysaccharide biosynthesis polyprenyl glycosylphosphotransferase [Candidatus Omnitrophota bacterium]MDD5574538.1 exopolysaccharide biosynthesis polyprenyl glycosylphosphotransferase [Candidatus Omnitrophota bacterium]
MSKHSRKLTFLFFFVILFAMAFTVLAGIFGSAWAQGDINVNNPVNPNSAVFSSQNEIDVTSRGRAPEPSSVALMASGFLAALVRFARRRFEEFKRVFDVFVSFVGLVISAPVLLAAAAAIKATSPGPVFFKQTRIGKKGKIFNIWKLRTMVCDAELQTGPVWATENDPRVTSVGKFLRKSRIDEIPQLVNVLKGEMSIIGPRPERPEFVGKLAGEIVDYRKRLKVKPGITGLAQIKQSYDATIKDVRRKVKLDLLYIKKMCFLTDLRILLGTISVVLTGRGAR